MRTARFAGEGATDADNRAHLLARARRASTTAGPASAPSPWSCGPTAREVAADGICDGTIAAAERGAPWLRLRRLFVPDDGDGRTFAEMDEDDKHAMSHRGRAFRALLAALAAR